jgi:ABC transporter with metal-binding/Fe-S-binding domain ATP-binding protein
MRALRAAVLFSGGKDSTLAAFEAKKAGHELRYLVSLFPRNSESYMFHYPNIGLTKIQAESMGIPIITHATKGEKEKELEDMENALKSIKEEIDCVVTGAIASEYQKSRIERICLKLGLKPVSPLWHRDPLELWKSCLDNGFRVMITAVACEGLDKGWLGRIIDAQSFKELKRLSEKYRFHLSGEGGEFETLVVNCPLFRKGLVINRSTIEWDEKTKSGFLLIEK